MEREKTRFEQTHNRFSLVAQGVTKRNHDLYMSVHPSFSPVQWQAIETMLSSLTCLLAAESANEMQKMIDTHHIKE